MASRQIADILHGYQQEVLQYHKLYETRLRTDPLIAKCEERIGELGLEKLGQTLAGSDTAAIDRRLAELEKRRRDRMQWLGLSPYLCEQCHDAGFVDGDYCMCMRRRIYREHYGARDLETVGPTLADYPLSMLDDVHKVKELGLTARELTRLSVNAFRDMLDRYPNGGCGMLICGLAGVGKTHMALAGAHEACVLGLDVLFLHAADMHDLYYRKRLGQPINTHYLETSGLLIVDDLGTEPLTQNVTKESLNRLLEIRDVRRLPTVFTTNLNNLQPVYGERLASRLSDERRFRYIKLGGIDLRTGREHKEDRSQSDRGPVRRNPLH